MSHRAKRPMRVLAKGILPWMPDGIRADDTQACGLRPWSPGASTVKPQTLWRHWEETQTGHCWEEQFLRRRGARKPRGSAELWRFLLVASLLYSTMVRHRLTCSLLEGYPECNCTSIHQVWQKKKGAHTCTHDTNQSYIYIYIYIYIYNINIYRRPSTNTDKS